MTDQDLPPLPFEQAAALVGCDVASLPPWVRSPPKKVVGRSGRTVYQYKLYSTETRHTRWEQVNPDSFTTTDEMISYIMSRRLAQIKENLATAARNVQLKAARKAAGYTTFRSVSEQDAARRAAGLPTATEILDAGSHEPMPAAADEAVIAAAEVAMMKSVPMSGPVAAAIARVKVRDQLNVRLDGGTGNTGALFGSSKSGKSTTLMMIYRKYYQGDNDYICTLFAQNAQIGLYKQDRRLIVTDKFGETSRRYLEMQRRINVKTDNAYRFVTFVDDFVDVRYNKMVNNMILSYRNSQMSTWICLQAAKLLSRAARSSVNTVMIFNCNLLESAIDLLKTFLGPYLRELGVKDENDQLAFLKWATHNHGFIQLHPASGTIQFYRLSL